MTTRLVSTNDVAKAQQVFNRIYAESTLESKRDAPFGCVLDALSCGQVNIVAAQWAGGGCATVPIVEHRYIITLSGGGLGGGQHAATPYFLVPGRSGAVFSPNRSATVDVEANFEGRTVTIERQALESHFRALTDRELTGPIAFEVALDLEHAAGASFNGILQVFLFEAQRPGASPLLTATLRDALFTALLTNVRHSASAHFDGPAPRAAPRQVRMVEEYLQARLAESVRMVDLAALTGTTIRSIQAAFRAHRGYTPMAFLAQQRLDLARRHLLAPAHDATVTAIALASGFMHLGRFSVEYRARFGEPPSSTLHRGLAGMTAGAPAAGPSSSELRDLDNHSSRSG